MVYLDLAVLFLLPYIELQFVVVVDTDEGGSAMIDVVTAMPQIKVKDVDGDDLYQF